MVSAPEVRAEHMKSRLFAIASTLLFFATAHAELANFDDLTEGWAGTTVVDGGITFTNLEARIPGGLTAKFAIDDASTSAQAPFISAPNVLGFNGFDNGGNAGFGRFYSMDFFTGNQASSASMLIGSSFEDPNTTVTLQGLLNGSVVASSTVGLTESDEQALFEVVSLPQGLYDSFHLVSSNANNDGAVWIEVDNVSITPVPEPATLAIIGSGLAALIRRRRK